jgi:hypothetical protein
VVHPVASRARAPVAFAFAVLLFALASCDAPAHLQPGAVLRDSLGLTSRDWVHTITLTERAGQSNIAPATVELRVGDWVDMRSGDGFVRVIRFEIDSLNAEARAWVRAQGIEASPPLLARGARWVVSFSEAPTGRYAFRVEGPTEPGRGALVVGAARRFPFYTP